MKKIVVIDGQGGRMGKTVVEQLKNTYPDLPLTAIGTNSIATSAMLKAGADLGATGENPVITAWELSLPIHCWVRSHRQCPRP